METWPGRGALWEGPGPAAGSDGAAGRGTSPTVTRINVAPSQPCLVPLSQELRSCCCPPVRDQNIIREGGGISRDHCPNVSLSDPHLLEHILGMLS